jgi:hypothetical protein
MTEVEQSLGVLQSL